MICYIFVSLCLFTFFSTTDGINCVSCVGWSNSGCNDPFDEATSGDLPVPGNTYCLKVVYPSYVERMAGGRTCTPGGGPGGSTRYCCSDQDYCNGIIRFGASTIVVSLLLIIVLCVSSN
ncbi:unnamed protein product [Adineta ricciae]|uniref:Uncharacterized protein n=1 Tax=Adineta ricciae TaxID=249248 RepID=A0A813YUY1_ADIRI|nr:unnamed protein product [Adineta ricciae]CAF0889426.1 unnamed protein product [Adineta ricciae]